MLDDGTYDALVVDADPLDDGRYSISLTLVSGERKGEVLDIVAGGLTEDPIALLGIPATLTVDGGEPTVSFEP